MIREIGKDLIFIAGYPVLVFHSIGDKIQGVPELLLEYKIV